MARTTPRTPYLFGYILNRLRRAAVLVNNVQCGLGIARIAARVGREVLAAFTVGHVAIYAGPRCNPVSGSVGDGLGGELHLGCLMLLDPFSSTAKPKDLQTNLRGSFALGYR